MPEHNDIVKEFLVESTENLDRLDLDFVALEQDPAARDRLANIFRTIHTIKGTCGFLGFSRLETVTHAGESLLSRLRDGDAAVNSEVITALLSMVDVVREIITNIESTATEGEGSDEQIISTLSHLNQKIGAAPAAAPAPAAAVPVAASPSPPVEEKPQRSAHPEPQPASPRDHPSTATQKTAESTGSSPATGGIRVDVGLLDKLMNLVGELVLARNQILQYSAGAENATLAGSTQRLNLITTELQEGVMKTRMQPIDTVWSKFPRIVRDLAQTCGKRVRIQMEGRETELDKTIIEAIKDPLTHIIRNSVDHGVETPEERARAGKPEEGLLSLRAFHEGGQVNIEITDDGGGINYERVKKKAVERGLITPDHAARMNDREVGNLIFLPGFSTAEKVTNVSGRGVGMDVVKTNIEKIGGSVDLQSRPGAGTTLRIKIPLTLAIIPALIITCGGDRYAIPQVSLLELVRLGEDQATAGIENIRGTPVYRLRGNLLPVVYLNKELGTHGTRGAGGSTNIVVLQADERQFGLVVDEINDTEEIVVKPLGKLFKGLTTFAGATIMGDGRVALILDVMGLAQAANVVAQAKDRGLHDTVTAGRDSNAKKQTLLLFRACGTRRMAIPLSHVDRLEEFPRAGVERSGDQQVVQYRGDIMPLVTLSQALQDGSHGATRYENETVSDGPLQVVVHSADGRHVGLVVDRIVDIVEQDIVVQRKSSRPGVLGAAVIDKKVTELLDVDGIVRAFTSPGEPGARAGAEVITHV